MNDVKFIYHNLIYNNNKIYIKNEKISTIIYEQNFLIILKFHLMETVYLIQSLIIFMEMNPIVKLFLIKYMNT